VGRGGESAWPFVGRDEELSRLRADVTDPEVVGVIVTAPAGAGKTRLVREVTKEAALPPQWWQAAEAVAAVPFGALASLLPEGDDATPSTAYRRVAAQVADCGGIVVVDDIPHLDARSTDLLHRLVDAGEATVVATARSSTPLPPRLEWLWAHEDARHHHLTPLTDDAVATLVDEVLGDLPERERARVVAALAARAAGNPLFVRALLQDVAERLARGRPLEPESGLPSHLVQVLDTRRRAAGEDAGAALEAVALLGALPLDLLLDRVGPDAVAAAERGGLVVVDDGPTPSAHPAHPLHAEASLAAVPTSRRRSRTEDLALAVLDHVDVLRQVRLAAVALLVRQGTPPAVEHLVATARTAFAALDHPLAVEIARAAIEAGDRFESRLVLGAALSGLGDAEAADAALLAALAASGDDDERARAAGRLSVHLVAHGTRIAEADAVLAEVEQSLVDPEALAYVRADRAKLATIRGEVVITPVPAADAGGPATLNAAIAGAYVQAMAGDAAACRATIAMALPLAERHRDVLPWADDLVRFSGTFAALAADGPLAATEEADAGLARSGPDASTVGTWRFLRGFARTVAGLLGPAADDLARAVDDLSGHDLIGARPLAVASQAWARAQAGDVERARALLDDSLLAATVDGRVRTQVAVADAWCDVVEGRTTIATQKLLAGARRAADDGQAVATVIALHDLIRIGAADQALGPLQQIAAPASATWLFAFVSGRAAAEAAGDLEALARLARRAAPCWPVAAAELHTVRARTLPHETDRARATVTALVAASHLDGPWPWTLRDLTWPITDREREVAEAVAHGATNRDVAARAGVSVRTVENQLQSAYRKLGLGGRRELAGLLEPVARAPGSE
jgi:DNA-binding CsgD family transcriptional regulator